MQFVSKHVDSKNDRYVYTFCIIDSRPIKLCTCSLSSLYRGWLEFVVKNYESMMNKFKMMIT